MQLALFRAFKALIAFSLVFTFSPVHAAPVKIGVVYDAGGRGDHSYDDAAAAGVDSIRKSLKLDQFALREVVALSDDFDKENRIEFLIKAGYNIVICIGPNFSTAVKYMAEKYPESQFSIIGSKSVDSVNVASIAFNNNEEAFLAGAFAAGSSKTLRVGYITSNTNIYKKSDFTNFTSGVNYINPKVKVFTKATTLNSNIDSQAMISAGVDVIYSTWNHDAQVLNQIISANKAKKSIKYIGKSPDQYFLSKNPAIVAIVNDRYDLAVREIVSASVSGKTLTDVINETNGVYGKLLGLKSKGFDFIVKVSNPNGASALAKAKSGLLANQIKLVD